jgi:hypothetical protein
VTKQTKKGMMNSELLYQWKEAIDKSFPEMGRWQKTGLGLLSYGMVLAQSSTLSQVAMHLTLGEQPNSMERRLQRWLANPLIQMEKLFEWWIKWVMSRWGNAPLLILVDETKLSNHVAVMMVSAYYQESAIPLIWRAYVPDDYPPEGQVEILTDLMNRLRQALPAGIEAVVLADRGLGTSPDWQDALTKLGWDYLLRVQGTTLIRLKGSKDQPLRRLTGYGQQWFGRGQVFKKAGWRWLTVFVIWQVGYDEPWCLVSNRRDCSPDLYAWRFSHEASFRDLKSDGFDWHQSRVWLPSHVERLVLGLALAAFWTLATGTLVVHLHSLTKRQQRNSVFRVGLDELFKRLRWVRFKCLELYLVPDTPCLKTVVL